MKKKKYFQKGGIPTTERIEDSRVSYITRKLLKEAGYKPQHVTKNKYRAMRFRGKVEVRNKGLQSIHVNLDYSSLQFIGVVRHYIQKKYDLKIRELELLLFLYPMNFFSRSDYDDFPHAYSTRTMTNMLERGFIEPCFDRYTNRSKKQVFKLSTSAKAFIKDFYDYLHGVKPVPENPKLNKLFQPHVTGREQVQAKAIAKLNMRIKGDGKYTKEHKKVNKRIVERATTDLKEKYEPFQDKIDAILEKKRIKEKMSEMEKKKKKK